MLNKFKHAFSGVRIGLVTDRSIRVHFMVAFLVILFGVIFELPPVEWAILLITIFMVMVLEYVNSAIEVFADRVHPDHHSAIKNTKDLAAAAVFLASICAFFVGIIIFVPPIFALLSGI